MSPAGTRRKRNLARRLQGALVVATLVAATVVTSLLVATPVASSPAPVAEVLPLPTGTRVELRGGDPMVAYRVADRLTASGAQLGAVAPARQGAPVADVTTIVYYDSGHLIAADRIRQSLGRGTVRRDEVFHPLADVTIVLGKDLSRA